MTNLKILSFFSPLVCYLDVEIVALLLCDMLLLLLIDSLQSSLIVPTCMLCAATASIDRFVVIDGVLAVLSMSKISSISYCSWWIVGEWWLLVMSICFSPLVGSKK
jgi:hypothetical protein